MATVIFTLRNQLQGLIQKAWTGTKKTNFVEYLVVAGGGAGAFVGGGGAGGLLQGVIPINTGSSITVTVGAGGTGVTGYGTGVQGANSVFGSITSAGGGAGGQQSYNSTTVNDGGSGGGGPGYGTVATVSTFYVGGNGIFGQGNSGGQGFDSSSIFNGGGGGGAGTVGLNAGSNTCGNGGAGIASAINGTVTSYAGGGGAGTSYGTSGYGTGGVGGGGSGTSGGGSAGTANTGGGGGGSSYNGSFTASGNGGSGIVIISYPDTYNAPTAVTGTYTASTSGSGSLSFSGTGQYLNYGGQSTFAFGSNSFTIECWIYPATSSQTADIFDFRPTGTSSTQPTLLLNSGVLNYYINSSTQISGGTPAASTWSHVALVRNGTNTILYLNGTQVGSTYSGDSTNYTNGANSPVIAGSGYSRGTGLFNGYISNFRVVNGTAVYTTTFTPPTAPLAPITNTVLLLGSVSGAYLADNSTNSYVATVTGSPAWNQASPFATGLGYKNRVYTWTGSGTVTF